MSILHDQVCCRCFFVGVFFVFVLPPQQIAHTLYSVFTLYCNYNPKQKQGGCTKCWMWENKVILNTENRIFTFQQTARSKCSSAWTSISLVAIAAAVDNQRERRESRLGYDKPLKKGGVRYIFFSRLFQYLSHKQYHITII